MTLGESEKADALFWIMVGWPEIARKQPGWGKKITKSIFHKPMVVETWLTPQNYRKIRISGGMQANYTHTTTGSAPKINYSDIWAPYMVKF